MTTQTSVAHPDGTRATTPIPGDGYPAEPAPFVDGTIRALRAEVSSWQAKAKELEVAATGAREELRTAQGVADARIIQAEMRMRAIRAGMIDPDGVRLLDFSDVKINAAGKLVGADAVIAEARVSRPWLFANARTGNPEPPPRPRDLREATDARQMAPADYAAARKSRAWRR